MDVSFLEQQVMRLTCLVSQIAAGKMQSMLHEDPVKQEEFPGPIYPPRPPSFQNSNSGMSLEDIVKSLASNQLQFQQETKASIQNLENQVSQMVTVVRRLEAYNFGNLPSETIVNPRENASAITLRSGEEVMMPVISIVEQEIFEPEGKDESEVALQLYIEEKGEEILPNELKATVATMNDFPVPEDAEQEEIQKEACGNARIDKEKMKIYFDKMIFWKEFQNRQHFFLYKSRLQLFSGAQLKMVMLNARWEATQCILCFISLFRL